VDVGTDQEIRETGAHGSAGAGNGNGRSLSPRFVQVHERRDFGYVGLIGRLPFFLKAAGAAQSNASIQRHKGASTFRGIGRKEAHRGRMSTATLNPTSTFDPWNESGATGAYPITSPTDILGTRTQVGSKVGAGPEGLLD